MILIDAVYINRGGGKVLLDYLIEELEKTNISIHYLIDYRVPAREYKIKESNRISYADSKLISRWKFYREHREFNKILILGNIPPLTKTNAVVYTYFHNSIYIKLPDGFSVVERVKFFLKVAVIRLTSVNTNKWFVQSAMIRDKFVNKFGQRDKMEILPFYPPLCDTDDGLGVIKRHKGVFLYVSDGYPNKNHKRLIDAFQLFYKKHKKGKLILTISENCPEVLAVIKKAQERQIPIVNIGFVNRCDLLKYYQESEFIIFASLSESFGLGLIEGVELGCKVIGADLPYTHAVCEPSLTFDPMDILSIANVFYRGVYEEIQPSRLITKNEIAKLITYLKE